MKFCLLFLLLISASSYAQQNKTQRPNASQGKVKNNYDFITLNYDINNYQVPYDDVLGIITAYKHPIYNILEKIILGLKNDSLDLNLVNNNFKDMIKLYIDSNDFPKDFTHYRFGSAYYTNDLYHVEFLLDRKIKGEMMLSFENNQYQLVAISTTTNF